MFGNLSTAGVGGLVIKKRLGPPPLLSPRCGSLRPAGSLPEQRRSARGGAGPGRHHSRTPFATIHPIAHHHHAPAMTLLLPSLQAERIRRSIVDYLSTTFALTDAEPRRVLTDFLEDEEQGVFVGPFVRLRLPYLAASARPDPQAKGLGEYLRSRLVDVPVELLP